MILTMSSLLGSMAFAQDEDLPGAALQEENLSEGGGGEVNYPASFEI